MDQRILVTHSDPSVIDSVVEAVTPLSRWIMVSPDAAMAETLCRRYRPDLLALGYEPDRYGGVDGYFRLIESVPTIQTILLTARETTSIPARYACGGVRYTHRLPLDPLRLRQQAERCLWLSQPHQAIKAIKDDIRERGRSLDTFLNISRSITANLRDDLDTVLRHIAEETSKILNAERTSLFIYDRERDCLWSRVAEGEGDRTITLGMDGSGIVVHVARIGQPLRVDDAYREPLFNSEVDRITGYHTRTILCAPVRNYRGELIGVIETLNKKAGLFDESDQRLLAIVSFLFAAAIGNAQLYEALVRQIHENRSLEASKIQAERLAMIGQMASSIIHDIRSPLAIIRGYAELAVIGSVTMEKRQRFAQTIHSEVRRLREMAEELQEFSEGTQTLHLTPTPLRQVIEEVVSVLGEKFRERNIHVIEYLQYENSLMLDASRFKRVLHNLANNAADAMPGGGTFMIATALIDHHIHLEIHDTGTGIPEAIRDRLFEPFVTFGKSHGTGLGLAVVKRIIEEHGGEISVVTGSAGTTFTMRFPVGDEMSHPVVDHPAASPS